MSKTEWNQKTAEELEDILAHKIVLPGTEQYAASREGWAATGNRPAMICVCETTADVQAAVVLARKKNKAISVRGGGHDWQGRSFIDGGIVIDLTRLNSIKIIAEAKTAMIGGGVKSIDLLKAAAEADLIAVTGTSGAVGVAGFTFGGGYGLTSAANGLGVDNLLAAEVVLADGSIVQASQTENPDLLWALCGGGGNFGVVTSLHIRLHPAKPILSGFFMFDLSEAESVLRGFEKLLQSAPDELYALTAVTTTPDGSTLLMVSPTWYGDPSRGRPVVEAFSKLGTPLRGEISAYSMTGLVESFDPMVINGRVCYAKTRWLSDLGPEVIRGIAAAAKHKTSALSMITLFQIHGAPARIPLTATAFGLRSEHYALIIVAEWMPDDHTNSAAHRKWAEDLSELIAPYSLPGGYPNILGNDDHEQIAVAHSINLPQLQRVKNKFDPDGNFTAVPLSR